MRPHFRQVFVCVLFFPLFSAAQVFKCSDGASGKVVFSDKPCATGQKSGEVKIFAGPVTPPPAAQMAPMSKEAIAYEKARAQRRADSDESHRRIDEAQGEVQRIKRQNADPQKCAGAKARMAAIELRDPLMYKADVDYMEYQQKANLYCGN